MDDITFPEDVQFDDIVPETIDTYDKVLQDSKVFLGDSTVTRDQMAADPTKRFWYLLQEFYRGGIMKSKDNDNMIRLYFHAIIGAYLKDYTVMKGGGATDLRTPIIWVQDSGSGKSQLNKFGVDVARKLGMKATETTEFTNAGMIGTHDKNAHEFNVKNGLTPGQSKIKKAKDGTETTLAYKDPIIYGDMKNHDLLFIDEGKILFQTGNHTENILSILQPALDYPGRVRKKLAAEVPIEYESSCTLIISTVEFSGLNGELMLQGFFPRCLFFMRKISFYNYAKMHSQLCHYVFDEDKYKGHIKNFTEAIMNHPTVPISRDRRKILVHESVLPLVSETITRWFEIARDSLHGREARIIAAFISRLHTFIYKIAGQVAVLNHKVKQNSIGKFEQFEIGMEEINYSLEVLTPLFKDLIKGMGVSETVFDKKISGIANKIMFEMKKKNMETITKTELINGITKVMNVGRGKSQAMYNELIRGNYFVESKLNEKGRRIVLIPNWQSHNREYDRYQKGEQFQEF